MPFVAIVTVLALLQCLWLGLRVAQARGRHGIPAPRTTGDEQFERHYRVHQNTNEQLLLFLPSLWIFAAYISPLWAAAFGVVYLIGRLVYVAAYLRDPKSRSLGFALSALPTLLMMIGIAIWAVRAIVLGAAW